MMVNSRKIRKQLQRQKISNLEKFILIFTAQVSRRKTFQQRAEIADFRVKHVLWTMLFFIYNYGESPCSSTRLAHLQPHFSGQRLQQRLVVLVNEESSPVVW